MYYHIYPILMPKSPKHSHALPVHERVVENE
jgi:hypothetical protein